MTTQPEGNAMRAVPLLPCPFCGGEPLEQRFDPHTHFLAQMPDYPGSWSVECVTCEVRVFDHDSHDNAVTKWNRRVPVSAQALPDEPTEEMLDRGAMEYAMTHQRVQTAEWSARDIYKAMLAAAPDAPPALPDDACPHVMSKFATRLDCLEARDKWHQERIKVLRKAFESCSTDEENKLRAQLTAAKSALQEMVDADLQCACSSYDAPSRLRYTKAVAKARDALVKP